VTLPLACIAVLSRFNFWC